MKKIYNKLIRDKIPQIIEQDGERAKIRILNQKDFVVELKKKVMEESKELVEAVKKDEVTNEIIDISELLEWLIKAFQLRKSSIEKSKKDKNKKRGSFKKRLFLEYTETKK